MDIILVRKMENKIFLLTIDRINSLIEEGRLSESRRSRIILHESNDSKVQEMIIVLFSDSIIKPHFHPEGKPESYHVIEGELIVNIFDNDGKIINKIELNTFNQKFYRADGNVIHQPISKTEYTVYHEVYTGPFIKEIDVNYVETPTCKN